MAISVVVEKRRKVSSKSQGLGGEDFSGYSKHALAGQRKSGFRDEGEVRIDFQQQLGGQFHKAAAA